MPGYRTKQERVCVAGVADLLIRCLSDRNQFSDPHGDAAQLGISSASWPMFGQLWPSGAQLAALVGARPVQAAERILEIGCGLGLASLVGHRRGADMTASDGHPLAGAFLAENLRLNALAPMKYRHGDWADAPPPLARDGAEHLRSVRGRFELIIGSDVLYERDEPGTLAAFIGRHAAPAAEVWIVDPDRGNRAAFHRRMAALGFDRDERRLDTPAAAGQPAYRGRLLSYRRSAPERR